MRLITVPEWSDSLKVRVPRGYELARRLPPGVRVELGRQVRINEEAWARLVEAGWAISEDGEASEGEGRSNVAA
jgi:hypothetical protein